MFAASKTSAAAAGAPPASTDPQFNYVTLLLNDTGTNGQQNNTFLDSSSNNFTITRNGTPTQGSVTPYWPDGQWSNYFSGTTQAFAAQPNSAFLFGTGDFTIELWAYIAGNSALDGGNARRATVFAVGSSINSGITFTIEGNSTTTGTGLSLFRNINTQTGIAVTGTVPQNAWNHIAVCRSGTSLRFFLNGTQMGSTITDSGIWGSSTYTPFVGGNPNNGSYTQYTNGYISNFRVVKGTALYTSNFTPSTTPLTAVSGTSLLTCQSNRFKDNSSNNFAITVTGTPTVQSFDPFSPAASYGVSNGGSGYFNGTSDYLTTSGGPTFSGDFTIEAWVYFANLPTFSMLLGETNFPSYVGIKPTAIEVGFARSSNYPNWNFTFVRNTWYHIAISRQSGTVRCFLNGQQLTLSSGSATDTSTLSDGDLAIGRYSYSPFYYFPGYISNLRIVNGTAVYTSAFTPPTSPVTAITNTSLLLNFTNAGIYDAAVQNDLVTVGNAQVSTAVAKFGSSSMAFDGSGDWLTFVDSPVARLEAGNFTVEGWVYLSTTGTAKYIAAKGTSTTGWALGVNASNQIVFNYTSSTLTGSTALSSGQWYHIAVVRNGTATDNVKIYLGGTADATSGGAINDNFNQTSIGYVGADRTGANAMNGYIEDLRITKGFARYTSAFTPPTAPFPTR